LAYELNHLISHPRTKHPGITHILKIQFPARWEKNSAGFFLMGMESLTGVATREAERLLGSTKRIYCPGDGFESIILFRNQGCRNKSITRQKPTKR